ncbi:MAG: hypothetical protein OK439_03870 [Thaumarchaeota archaeon]|nr:hypothetical protein [Nitrososphaerota archaeon]
MRARSLAFLVLAIIVLLISPILISFTSQPFVLGSKVLASSSYSENLSLYLTSGETLWKVNLSGGNISVNSLTVPSSVTGYSITLTHYSAWKSQFEIFTTYGFGLLGGTEPYPDGSVLTINTTSQSDAAQLANSLGMRFGLAFQQISTTAKGFTFFSPISFSTEIHVYFWQLIPQTAGGFATLVTESQLESGDLNFYELSYSSNPGNYAVSYGGLSALSSNSFRLYSQLGLLQTAYNYSTVAQSSSINIHVLGGLVSNSTSPFVNNFSNLSASITANRASDNHTIAVPDINATLDFSFPTILAYRQISPTLTPSRSSNVSVTIFVQNVSPTSTPEANNVRVNDSWIYQNKNDFNLTVGQTGRISNLTSGQTETIAYAFTVLASNGTVNIPATPVSYQFSSVANKTVTATAYLNPETIFIGATNRPSIEATESLPSGTIQAGQTFSVNVTIANKGSGAAFNLVSGSLKKSNLPSGARWSYLANATSGGLTSTNSTVSYPVSWADASGKTQNTTTNIMSAVFSFSSPGTPAAYLQKNIILSNSSKSANVTLTVLNGSPSELTNLTVNDPIPSGISFGKSYNPSSLRETNGVVDLNVSSLTASSNRTFVYSVNISNTNENFVFLPASVSANWNGITIVHYSQGYGLPLGIKASKLITPSLGFQGTNVTISIGLVNRGSLPVYDINLGSSFDQFVQVTSNTSSTTQAVLNSGANISRNLNAYLTGTQGTFNTSSVAATFLFAGTNQTASSNTSKVTVYALPVANATFSALKIEEAHDITVKIMVSNPSNVTINHVVYTVHVPKGISILNGNSNFSTQSIGPNSNYTNQFTIISNQPNAYVFDKANLTFLYQNNKVQGNASSFVLNISDDIPLRYGIPIVIGLVIVIGTLFYVRRETKQAT